VLRPLALLPLLLAAAASAQTTTVVFDEDDAAGDAYYAASDGGAAGNATLALAGPDGDRLPVATGDAASGQDYGVVEYAHGDGGAWALRVGAPGFETLDLADADSVVLFLNGPVGVPGVDLPRLALEDADGDRTAALALDFGTLVGLSRTGSGFLDGSPTDATFSVGYVESLPPDLARPGYPETLVLTFADEAISTSTPAIGIPAVPANFRVETEGGMELAFQFRDLDEDGTLSGPDESITVLTPEAEGSTRLRPTWRITTAGTPDTPPAEGDVYRLAVFNSGVDSDPDTWQRRAVAVSEFGPLGAFDLGRLRAVVFENAAEPTSRRTLWVDAVAGLAYDGDPEGPAPPTAITAETGDQTVLLRWTPTPGAIGVHVFRQSGDGPFQLLTEQRVRQDHYADLDAENGEAYTYVLRSVAPNGLRDPIPGPDSSPLAAAPVEGAPDPYIDLTARLAFDYFWKEANPQNGLIKDRSTPGSASSIAAVGFGLSAITVGIDRGYVTRDAGAERVAATLDFFATCPQGDATSGTCGYRGFFYHFLNMDSGERAGTNELSTIDTALLLGGVLHAAQYFDGQGETEARIRQRADQIWRRVEWDWAAPRPPLVTLGWKPEVGFNICNGNPCDWRGYNEAMILYVLGLGSPTHPLPDGAWDAWTERYDRDWQTHYGITFLTFPPLFGHQYSHVWIDFRGRADAYMRAKGIDYFENSRRATLAQRAYAIDNPRNYPNYGPSEWGITASDVPNGYLARGAPPAQNDNGTIAPTAAGGSYAFTPELSREALRTFYRKYRPRLWGEYGLKDAYSVEDDWFSPVYLGIDQGPILLMIENERTGAIWDSFMTHPDVQRGLERAGFERFVADEAEAEAALALAPPAPNPSAGPVRFAFATSAPGRVRLTVLDVLGREVAVLAAGVRQPREHEATWDASAVAAGVYVVRLEAEGAHLSRTFVVAR
jgi:hypothetical protein